jgi:hypothetical protein
MKENAISAYDITMEDVTKAAPVVYISIQRYLDNIKKMGVFLGCIVENNDVMIKATTDALPILDYSREYDASFMECEDFSINVVYYLCICKIKGYTGNLDEMDPNFLTWESFLVMYKAMDEMFYSKKHSDHQTLDIMMMSKLKVDPKALTKRYLQEISKLEELARANELISFEIKDLDYFGFNGKYTDYEEYYDYIKKHAVRITDICHTAEFFNTQNIDKFTCTIIANKMRLPCPYYLYEINSTTKSNTKKHDVELINSINKDLLMNMLDNGYFDNEKNK